MSTSRAAAVADSPDASKNGGEELRRRRVGEQPEQPQ